MILIEKDRHMTRNEPFFSAQKDYNEWLVNNAVLNSVDNVYISLGDWYTLATPKPDEINETESFFNNFKCKKIILAGNHDFSDSDKIWSIYPLKNSPETEIVLEPCVKTIESHTFAFLPFYKHLSNFPPMKEYYTNLSEDFINADFICYHFEDETMGKKGIDISYLKGKRLGGHIHCSQKNYEIGMPIISRYDERDQNNNLFCIQKDKQFFIDIPKFIDYYSLNYGELPNKTLAKYPIWDINNAVSRKQALTFYEDYTLYIHKINILSKKNKNIQNDSKKFNIVDFFNSYVSNRTDLTDSSIAELKNTIMSHS
jgi:hypothetical protein